MSTPSEWLEQEQEKAAILADVDVYLLLETGGMKTAFLLMLDGFRALGAYCLAANGTLVVLSGGSDEK